MFSTMLVVFREILEAALVVSIVMAATKTVPGRGFWVGLGIVGGTVGAGLVAAFAEVISQWASGMGQELFNAAVMFVAVLMLSWHCIWMGKHGREMAQSLGSMGRAVTAGSKSLSGLAIVVGVALLREGSEAVLFIYGIAAGEPGQATQMAIGAVIGLAGGVAVGAALYFGLLQINTRRLFSVTNGLILLLAAGMASQCAGFLIAADWLPAWGDMWDTSWLLTDNSVVGKMLHALVGYTARPAGTQLIAYIGTLLLITLLARKFGRPTPRAAIK